MKQVVTGLLVAALLLLGGVPWAMADGKILKKNPDGTVTEWGLVTPYVIASGVTTNTTTTPVGGPAGEKTYWAHVTGTGAVTATIVHWGCQTNATTYCVALGTITLSGTTASYGVPTPAVGSANYPYHYIVTTNVTGTGATVAAGVNY